ncbi:MAG: aldose epimerase [Leptolyngbyaceae cyanobacterium bins.59]|nr:aldose epimerase [Leptolyngbyaceae cyanobacterium bins.59]
MFTIAVKQEQYQTYILSDHAAESHLRLVPERGGIALKWQLQGQEIFYLDEERYTHPELTVRGGNPILFPICGNLPENTYQYQGKTYTLKQHGFARELPWTVGEQITQDQASLTLELTSHEQTRSVYPFEFQVAFTYVLKGNVCEIQQSYTNRGDGRMPFSAGFHPYFLAPDKSQLQIAIPATQLTDQRTRITHPFDGTFDFGVDEIDVMFRSLESQTATVVDTSRNLKVTLESDTPFKTLVFWTLIGKPFYCLEPWTAPRNALNTGDDLLYLEAGETLKTWVRLTVNQG